MTEYTMERELPTAYRHLAVASLCCNHKHPAICDENVEKKQLGGFYPLQSEVKLSSVWMQARVGGETVCCHAVRITKSALAPDSCPKSG